jgi:hypothetical protein
MMKPWFGSWPPRLPCKRQDDYLRRIEEIHRDVSGYSGGLFNSPFGRKVFGTERDGKHEADLTERVRALCQFAEISVAAWKELGWTNVMLDYAREFRRLKETDCKECDCMPPWHKVSCSKSGAKVHWDGGVSISSAAGARNGD